jgi:hypothetical protein
MAKRKIKMWDLPFTIVGDDREMGFAGGDINAAERLLQHLKVAFPKVQNWKIVEVSAQVTR